MDRSAQAGKRRRAASLEKLRDRDATERWSDLQRAWQAIPDEQPEQQQPPSAVDNEPHDIAPPTSKDRSFFTPPAQATSQTPAERPERSIPFEFPEPPSFDQRQRMAAPVEPRPPAPPGNVIVPQDKPVPREPVVDEAPLLVFDQPLAPPADAGKRTAAASSVAAVNMQSRPQADVDARPKPITSILPYYDYSPDGQSPCEFLCPTPEGCPETQRSKPCPEMVELPVVPFEDRCFADMHVTWEASNLFSNPLYFEDAQLERYGHTHNHLIQPLVSLGKFGVQLVGLPYQMALHPIHERRYALGWYRPGECAPYKYYLPPWNAKAAATAGAAYTGLFFLIP